MLNKEIKMNVKGLSLGSVLITVLFVSGCSGINTQQPTSVVTPPKPINSKQQSWQQRQAVLANKVNWGLNSKASLRVKDENFIFRFNWNQLNANNYVIDINNPITGGLISRLSRTNSTISLLAENGRTFQDTDEERLLQSQSGLKIPVKGLKYWVRGLTSPQYKVDQLLLDNSGRPNTIQQAGWKVVYTGYVDNSSNALPRKINLSRGAEEIFIRVVAKNWK